MTQASRRARGRRQARIAPNVTLGGGLRPAAAVHRRQAAAGRRRGRAPLAIGAGAVIRPFTTIYAGSTFGARLQTGQGASIREDNEVGDDVSIGTNAVLEFGNRIGNRVRIHSGCFLELVTIEDDVFVGPNVVFTDDPHPMGCPRYQDCKGGAVVRRLARIGANSTILPGVDHRRGRAGRRRVRRRRTTFPPAPSSPATRLASSSRSTSSPARRGGSSVPTLGRRTRNRRTKGRDVPSLVGDGPL